MQIEEYVTKKKMIKKLQDEVKEFEDHEKSEMIKQGMATMVTKYGTFTVKKAYERKSFDTKRFKEEHAELYPEYEKVSKVAESISFKIKE